MDQTLQLALIVLQGLWALFLVVMSFSVRRLVRDIEENTKEIGLVSDKLNSLNIALLGNFVSKEDWIYIRQRVHDLGDAVGAIRAREELREQMDKGGRG